MIRLTWRNGIRCDHQTGAKTLLPAIPRRKPKRTGIPDHPEARLQIAIVEFLELVAPHCFVFFIPNHGRKAPEIVRLVAMGMKPGIHDLCLLAPVGDHWEPHFLEIKGPNGRRSHSQEELHLLFTKRGIRNATVWSIDDVRMALAYWKIQTREVPIL